VGAADRSLTDRGQRWTLLAAFFYAPSVITIKQAILTSDPATGTLAAMRPPVSS